MDQDAVLAAYDEQVRQHAGPVGPGEVVERGDRVVRVIADGWGGVTWSDLDPASADVVIAAQVTRFAQLGRPWEWKHYSYDRPADLSERLVAAGLTAEPAESLMVAEIADLAVDVPPPAGVLLQPVVDEEGVEAFLGLHRDVFGGDAADPIDAAARASAIGRTLLAALAEEAPSNVAVLAWAGGTAVGAGRVELQPGTDFASIWGGGTLPAWRGRGVFRSIVAHRAAQAAARGFRYLQVDAMPASRPILQRLGFVALATTTPYVHPGRLAGGPRPAARVSLTRRGSRRWPQR